MEYRNIETGIYFSILLSNLSNEHMQLAVEKWEILVAHDNTDRCLSTKLLHKRPIISCRIPLPSS